MLELSFERSLYDHESITEATTAYGALATFAIDTTADHITVSVSEIDPRVADRLEDAFCNHVLFDTIRRARPSAEDLRK